MKSKKLQNLALSVLSIVVLASVASIVLQGSYTPQTADKNSELAPPVTRAILSDREKIEGSIKELFDGNKLRGYDILEGDQGFVVDIRINASDNFTTNMIRMGIEKDMTLAYKEIFNRVENVDTVFIDAYLPLTDQYGNENDGSVYKTALDKDTASRVNWEADTANLYQNILPNAWETITLHAVIR